MDGLANSPFKALKDHTTGVLRKPNRQISQIRNHGVKQLQLHVAPTPSYRVIVIGAIAKTMAVLPTTVCTFMSYDIVSTT